MTARTSSSTRTPCGSAARPATSGPASLSMTVTDGESGTDPAGRTGTIVIPIDVQPTEDQPPTFIGGVIDFEPGQSKTIDLVKLTDVSVPRAPRRTGLPHPRAAARRLLAVARRPGAHHLGRRGDPDGWQQAHRLDRRARRRQRGHRRPDRAARGAVDPAARPARRRLRRHRPRPHDDHRRARERPGPRTRSRARPCAWCG